MPEVKAKTGLTGNQLKIIAMVSMTLDHIGFILLPQSTILRIIGRLAFPIYAYMVAEGCRYTHDIRGYFLRLLGLGLVCQVVSYAVTRSLYQCILITFSLSVVLIMVLEQWGKQRKLAVAAVFLAVGFLCEGLPLLLPHTDYGVDYGLIGVCVPVLVWLGKSKKQKLWLAALGLALLGGYYGGWQFFALAAVPLLALYNGQRGKYAIGKLFYIYYPLHLAVLYGIWWIFLL